MPGPVGRFLANELAQSILGTEQIAGHHLHPYARIFQKTGDLDKARLITQRSPSSSASDGYILTIIDYLSSIVSSMPRFEALSEIARTSNITSLFYF